MVRFTLLLVFLLSLVVSSTAGEILATGASDGGTSVEVYANDGTTTAEVGIAIRIDGPGSCSLTLTGTNPVVVSSDASVAFSVPASDEVTVSADTGTICSWVVVDAS